MRPLVPISLSSITTSPWVPLDYMEIGQVTFDLSFNGGTATAQVDFTDDDVFNPAITPVVAGQVVATGSTNSVTRTAYVPRAIRLNVTAFTSGPVTLKVIQQGIRGG